MTSFTTSFLKNGTCKSWEIKQFSRNATAGVNTYKIYFQRKKIGEHNGSSVMRTPDEKKATKY